MFRKHWKSPFSSVFVARRPAKRATRHQPDLQIEQLENRLAFAVTVTFQNGNLTIDGDNAGNNITLTRQANGNLTVTADSQITTIGGVPTLNNVAKIVLNGKAGNDTITLKEIGGSLPRVTIFGGSGNDTIQSGSGADIIFGGPGNDIVFGGTGDDRISGQDGDDELHGGAGVDVIFGGLNNDKVFGDAGDDRLDGEDGNDTLMGNAGDDTISGGIGNDTLIGGAGSDSLKGGLGNDSYAFDPDNPEGIDSLTELSGQGTDTLRFSAVTTTGVTVDLSKATPQLVATNLTIKLSANNTFENAIGGALNDVLIGNTRVNRFTGGAGQDEFGHHGIGDGIDVVTDMSSTQSDIVSFVTGGVLSAAVLTIDATAKELRDVGTNSFGFNFVVPVLDASSRYKFGITDTTIQGSLFTFNGTGGIGLGSNGDALLASYRSSSATLGGAGFRQRIIDYSANANTLAGRDGDDILIGGAGNNNINGDEGFNPGGNDTLTGGRGSDTFFFGQPFTGVNQTFGNDTITDFVSRFDKIKLAPNLSVRSGLGTTLVTIWNGVDDFGTISAANGHLWTQRDFA